MSVFDSTFIIKLEIIFSKFRSQKECYIIWDLWWKLNIPGLTPNGVDLTITRKKVTHDDFMTNAFHITDPLWRESQRGSAKKGQ